MPEANRIPNDGIAMPKNHSFVSTSGIRVQMVDGQPQFNMDDVQAMLCEEAKKLAKETRPIVREAQDARAVVTELLHGIHGEMEKFHKDTKRYFEEIRQVRFAIVKETNEIIEPLKDVRKFFMGSEYKEEQARLREFVELCERLNALKQSGFLDSVADTMLNLASK